MGTMTMKGRVIKNHLCQFMAERLRHKRGMMSNFLIRIKTGQDRFTQSLLTAK